MSENIVPIGESELDCLKKEWVRLKLAVNEKWEMIGMITADKDKAESDYCKLHQMLVHIEDQIRQHENQTNKS